MQLKVFLPLLLFAVFISACKKEDEVVYPNYSQLKVGNSWIYQRFDIDSSGHSTPTNIYDSCFVEKDTVIRNDTYFKVFRPDPYGQNSNHSYLRDSLHCIVDDKGNILFSSEDISIVLNESYYIVHDDDTVCRITSHMETPGDVIGVPVGSFPSICLVKTFYMYPAWASNGNPRYMNTYYGENVGIVLETLPFFTGSPNYTQRQLVRYHLN